MRYKLICTLFSPVSSGRLNALNRVATCKDQDQTIKLILDCFVLCCCVCVVVVLRS